MPISISPYATVGLVMTASSCVRQSGFMRTTVSARVASFTVRLPMRSSRPSMRVSSSGRSRAMTSMTFCCSAAVDDRLAAPRTACSAQSTLRPRSSARPRM
jgi:hypothetical protein